MKARVTRVLIVAAALVAGLSHVPALAQQEVPAGNRALLVLRVLAYDRKLPAKVTDAVGIAVAYRKGHADSESCRKEMETALTSAGGKATVAGKQPKATSVAYSSAFQEDLAAADAVSVYLCPGLDDVLDSITKLSRSQSLLTFAGRESYVNGGVAIGLVLREQKAAIVVNLPAAKSEGADLDAALLARAEVRK